MRKPTITKTWVAGIGVTVVGLIIGFVSMGMMLANGGYYTPSLNGGNDFHPYLDTYFWTTLWVMVFGFTVAAAGGVAQLVAWIGSLANTYALEDKTWFLVQLIGGLAGLVFGLVGVAVMLAYVIAGPDGTLVEARRPVMPAATAPVGPLYASPYVEPQQTPQPMTSQAQEQPVPAPVEQAPSQEPSTPETRPLTPVG